jgi:hypothetical protein
MVNRVLAETVIPSDVFVAVEPAANGRNIED